MPDLIPGPVGLTGTDVLAPAAVASHAADDLARAAAAALLAVTGGAEPGELAEPATLRAITGVLALATSELPGLFRRMSARSGDIYATGQHGRQPTAAGSFWFQMEAAADAAVRLHLALDAAHAAALQLHKGGDDR